MKILDTNIISEYLPPRAKAAHKGDFGHVLIVGGNYGMAGAAIMAAGAAARVGAGLTSVATRAEHVIVMNATQPEIICHGIHTADDLLPLLSKATVIAIGPGLGQSTWSKQLFNKVLTCEQPKVLDADALNLLSQNPIHNNNWILTPHVGEAARLLNCSNTEIQADRIAAVTKLQQQYGGVIVLKGAGTLIASADEIAICNAGNPGMASGGMGDVLTGIIAGLVAQKLELKIAAQLGVWIHAHAGDLAAAAQGERGLLATDLLLYIRQVANLIKK